MVAVYLLRIIWISEVQITLILTDVICDTIGSPVIDSVY
jgi:hypothetical protein